MAYYRTVDCILGHQSSPDLNLSSRQAAAACGLHGGSVTNRRLPTRTGTDAP